MVLKTMKTSVEFSYLPANECVDSNVVWSKIAMGKDHVWLLRVYQDNSEMNIEFRGVMPIEAARLVFNEPKRAHVTPLFVSLHWLPVAARIQFKTLMLAYRTTTGSAPSYFHSLLRTYIPSRSPAYFHSLLRIYILSRSPAYFHSLLRIYIPSRSPAYFHSLLRIYIPSRSLRSASERRLVVHHREAQNHSPEHSRSPFLAAGMIFPPPSGMLDPCQSSSNN